MGICLFRLWQELLAKGDDSMDVHKRLRQFRPTTTISLMGTGRTRLPLCWSLRLDFTGSITSTAVIKATSWASTWKSRMRNAFADKWPISVSMLRKKLPARPASKKNDAGSP